MPTEHDARALLARAAATIDVDETAPLTLTGLPEPRTRRWPIVVAAAAAVVIAIGGGWLVAQQVGGPEGKRPVPLTAPTHESTRAHDNTMPGLIGLTQAEATRLLEQRGLTVQVEGQRTYCNVPGIVTGSTPPVGSTLVAGGERVTIRVTTVQPTFGCLMDPPWDAIWDLVRYARGVEPHPEHVDPSGVPHDAAVALQRLVTQSWAGGSPRLRVRRIHEDSAGVGWDLRIWVQTPANTSGPASWLLARLDAGGDIRQVAVDSVRVGMWDDLGPVRRVAAREFVDWARGDGPAPDFADRVRHFGGGFSPRWNTDPGSRGSWAGCSGVGFPGCVVDPVGAVTRYRGAVVSVTGPACGQGAEVPGFARSERDLTGLEAVVDGPCSPLVDLWIDADGVIYGVRQAGMEP